MNRQRCTALLISLVCVVPALASHQETGGVSNTSDQIQICISANDTGSPATYSLTFYGPDGQNLLSRNFYNIPVNGIGQLVYTGLESPVSCELDTISGSRGDTSLNILNRVPSRVTALAGNHNSGDAEPVANTRRQYPACVGKCRGSDCSFTLSWFDARGTTVASANYTGVPANGSRQLLYTGIRSPVWCEGAFTGGGITTVLLLDRSTGRVDAGHANDNSGQSRETGPVANDNDQYPVCVARCPSSGGCNFNLRFHGPDGQVLVGESYTAVPSNGIRELVYTGTQSPVSCVSSGGSSVVSMNLLDRVNGRVEAVVGNTSSGSERPVVNAPSQYPICTGNCDGSGSCSFTLRWHGPDGAELLSETFSGTPGQGARQSIYTGNVSPVWCDHSSSGEGNIELVDRLSGNVDAVHLNR